MRLVLLLVAKDLTRRLRAPLPLVILLLFPVFFAGVMALVFGTRGDAAPKVRLAIENRDDGLLARLLVSSFGSEQLAKLFEVTSVETDGRALVEEGKVSALLVIPERFTQDVLDGKAVTLSLVRNPAEGILPEIAEQVASLMTLVLDGGARVLREPMGEVRPFFEDAAGAPTDARVSEISVVFNRTIREAGKFALPPAIALEGAFGETTKTEGSSSNASFIFLLVLPGVAVYSLFLIGDAAMRDVITETALGTLRRQLAGPVSVRTILLAKTVYTFALSLLCLAVLAAVGGFVLESAVSAPAFVVLSLAVVLTVAGASAFIYGLARTERRGATTSSIVYLSMAFLGGSFVPIDNLPAAVRKIAPLTPFYWGTRGFQEILGKGAGLADVATNVAILAALGAALLAVGVVALARSMRSGAVAA